MRMLFPTPLILCLLLLVQQLSSGYVSADSSDGNLDTATSSCVGEDCKMELDILNGNQPGQAEGDEGLDDDDEEDDEDDEEDDESDYYEEEDLCVDSDEECPGWAENGECTKNPKFMLDACQLSCDVCEREVEGSACHDEHERCSEWASIGECQANPVYMTRDCRKSCKVCTSKKLNKASILVGKDIGVAQITFPGDGTERQDIHYIIRKAQNYMRMVVPTKFQAGMEGLCKNLSPKCAWWAAKGECLKNAKYMQETCAPVCGTCESKTVEGRCPMDPDAPNAWGPGDLDKMFARLTSEPYLSKHSVEILSSPATDGPWVITMEDVLSEEEALRFIELGGHEGYERSADVGSMKADGSFTHNVNDGRTSENTWCMDECYKDETAVRVVDRLSNITEIPEANSEYLQLLRYEEGQYYRVHHDYIKHHLERQCGVRLLTMFLYLNDVEAGGGTNFDKLDITVMPKRGRAVLWPSVMNDDPNLVDSRTTHQALPVEKGIKFGANAWFHLRDFKEPNSKNCV